MMKLFLSYYENILSEMILKEANPCYGLLCIKMLFDCSHDECMMFSVFKRSWCIILCIMYECLHTWLISCCSGAEQGCQPDDLISEAHRDDILVR